MERAEKHELVETMHGTLKNAGVVIVAHYAGMNVAEMTDLRSQMRDAGGYVKVAKNRLVKIALKGTEAEALVDLFSGQTVIAYSDDPVAAPKVATNFAKDNDKLVILGGAMGNTVLNPEGVKSLASLPSLDELRGKLVGLLQAPAGKIAQVVNAPAGQLARVIGAYSQKTDEAA
ncbi:MAG: 50S ribosomal protein L10 [Pseudomonadota bacterium]